MLEHLGPKIRQIRKQKGMTLVEIAGKTGIAQATLSRIETGTMIGTVESHAKIAEILGVPLAELYAEPGALPAQTVHSPARRPVHFEKNAHWEMLTSGNPQNRMQPSIAVLQPEAQTSPEQSPRGTEKFIYVLEGEAAVTVEPQDFVLKTGETLYFDASVPHQLKNLSGNPARLLIVSCGA